MSRQFPLAGVVLTILVLFLTGCHPQQPVYLFDDGDLSHYINKATEIEYPDANVADLPEAQGGVRPFSLQNMEAREVWNLTLEEAVRNALVNGKILRSLGGQVISSTMVPPPDFISRNPELAPTVYDPAIAESDPRFGVEAALSAFDTHFTSSLFWEQNDTPRNPFPNLEQFFPTVFREDLSGFQAQLQKTAATGGTWTLRHNVQYDFQKDVARIFPADWTTNVEAEFRQPLLQGNGVQFNRIAGPGAIPGYNNGVMIARINTDVALANFEEGVRNMVSDVEGAYWELYFAYRALDAVVAGRDSALGTWRKIHSLFATGSKGGELEKEAQAREQYFLFRSSVETALDNLYASEARLRYMMGLAPTDCRLIRPADEPTTAKVVFDWCESHAETMARNAELREQKWLVKRRELELIASKNYLLPRLDAVGRYRWLGLGPKMIDTTDHGNVFDNAYGSMTSGDFQEWHFGLEFSAPLGFRKEMSGVRNAQLNLARERARFQEMQLEVTHQLASAIREVEAKQVLAQTNFNRRVAAQRQVEAVDAAYDVGTVTLDLKLEARRRLAQAESDYYRTLVDFQKAITEVHYRKGSLLEYNGVCLTEGPWPAKAYFDALRRARARDASWYLDYGFTQPKVVSRGPINQQAGAGAGLFDGGIESGPPTEAPPEQIPTPAPEPVRRPTPTEPSPPQPQGEPQAGGPRLVAPQTTGTRLAEKPSAPDNGKVTPEPTAPKLGGTTTPPTATPPKAAGGWSAVQKASFQEPATKWSTQYESLPNPPAAETARSASGWKGVQR